MVRNSWEQQYEGNGLHVLAAKLKRLKTVLQSWNKDVFGHLGHNISQAEDNLQKAKAEYERIPPLLTESCINMLRQSTFLILKVTKNIGGKNCL